MRRIMPIAGLALVVLALGSTSKAQSISGDYIETRSADVWTGSCVANGEVNLAGDQAILAWRINKGEWKGVSLEGLSVVGVVKANATLGDQFNNPYPAKSVVIVDERACPEQQKALLEFAQSMSGKLLNNVVRVDLAPHLLLEEGVQHHRADAGVDQRDHAATMATTARRWCRLESLPGYKLERLAARITSAAMKMSTISRWLR